MTNQVSKIIKIKIRILIKNKIKLYHTLKKIIIIKYNKLKNKIKKLKKMNICQKNKFNNKIIFVLLINIRIK